MRISLYPPLLTAHLTTIQEFFDALYIVLNIKEGQHMSSMKTTISHRVDEIKKDPSKKSDGAQGDMRKAVAKNQAFNNTCACPPFQWNRRGAEHRGMSRKDPWPKSLLAERRTFFNGYFMSNPQTPCDPVLRRGCRPNGSPCVCVQAVQIQG